MSLQDTMAIANVLVGLLTLGVVSVVTYRSLKHPEKITRLLHDTPVVVMYVLGTWLLVPLGWAWGAGYVACVIVSNWWFTSRVCPHCRCYGRHDGPSLYCIIASRLAKKADKPLFAQHFRRNTKVMAAGWILPPIGGIVLLVRAYGCPWLFVGSIVMLMAFLLIAFWLVPVGAKPRCERCDNRDDCPHGQPPVPGASGTG
jgi:hypothetical protein